MNHSSLPDLFQTNDGTMVKSGQEWEKRRKEILTILLEYEYGFPPPTPDSTRGEFLHEHSISALNDVRHVHYRMVVGSEPPFSFYLELFIPAGEGPFPVVLDGDGCWRYITDAVIREVTGRDYILAVFNRVTIVPDDYRMERNQGIYQLFPDQDFGALMAWAWGYHRCVDFLVNFPEVNPRQVVAVGHSRGGKTALLAGALDERIALTAPNNSGCGGAGCYRVEGEGSEKLGDILRLAPNWFSPRLAEFVGREDQLPFDQHFLKALVAPRILLSTEALGDLWANPSGTWHTHQSAREVYRFLESEQRIGIWYRNGGHNHGLEDWQAMLDFADWHFWGKVPRYNYHVNPFSPAVK